MLLETKNLSLEIDNLQILEDINLTIGECEIHVLLGARGHVDCLEIVRGYGVVSAIPEVRVTHPKVKVTHEAAIGSIDQKQFEMLMSWGLSPDEAVDKIIIGMLH